MYYCKPCAEPIADQDKWPKWCIRCAAIYNPEHLKSGELVQEKPLPEESGFLIALISMVFGDILAPTQLLNRYLTNLWEEIIQ